MTKIEKLCEISLSEVQNYEKAFITSSNARFKDSIIAIAEIHEDDKQEFWVICRNQTPNGVENANEGVFFASYFSPNGPIVLEACGFEKQWRSSKLKLLSKNFFKVKRSANFKFDCIDNKIEALDEEPILIPSLTEYVSFSTAQKRKLKKNKLKPKREVPVVTSLPDRPILDKVQDEIFRKSIASPVLILGAPGTGKTTVQVKRLSQKTKKDFLTKEEKNFFTNIDFNDNADWLFFTPTILLKHYLKESLSREELVTSDQNVKVWSDHRQNILSILKYIGANRRALARTRTVILKSTDSSFVFDYAKSFEDFLISGVTEHIENSNLRSDENTSLGPLGLLSNEGGRRVFLEIVDKLIVKFYGEFRSSLKTKNNYLKEGSEIDDFLSSKKIQVCEEELDVILYVSLSFIYDHWRTAYGSIENTPGSIQALIELKRNLISVDEASDFSLVQLGCISLLCKLGKGVGLTLSGDIMQRMTTGGIDCWDDLRELGLEFEEFTLETPYRQTKRLYAFTRKVHDHFLNRSESPMGLAKVSEPDPTDPKILVCNDRSIEAQIEWISDRITEIFELSDNRLPTLGVVLPTEDEISGVTAKLGDKLLSNSFEVEGSYQGQSLGVESKVRVFSVEHVKGIEFEAVFFMGFDRIIETYPKMWSKFLYVGSSRSRKFLSLTIQDKWPEALRFIKDDISEEESFIGGNLTLSWRSYFDADEVELTFSQTEQRTLDATFINEPELLEKLIDKGFETESPTLTSLEILSNKDKKFEEIEDVECRSIVKLVSKLKNI